MSVRSNGRHWQRGKISSGGFSSLSLGSNSYPKVPGRHHLQAPITPVAVNKSLLTPVNIDIDPCIQVIRIEEKEQIKTLNNRFISFIDKVRVLEQQNKMLQTQWKLLEEQKEASSKIEPMLKSYIHSLQRQLDELNSGKTKLDQQNAAVHKDVDNYRTQYEIEINKRNEAENEFVMTKKDVDCGYMSNLDLEDRLVGISDDLNFFKTLYDMELRELQESLKETSVVVQMDNSRGLNMDQIVSDVKFQYENIAARSRDDAENWYKQKFHQMTSMANQTDTELRNTKGDISELHRMISRLQMEIQAVQGQCGNLEGQITEAEQRGDAAVDEAKLRIKDLELAIQRAKQDMARQIREYQDLMNIKLALDIEISTYKRLLEGEEDRFGRPSAVNIQPNMDQTRQSNSQRALLIKTIETQDTTYS